MPRGLSRDWALCVLVLVWFWRTRFMLLWMSNWEIVKVACSKPFYLFCSLVLPYLQMTLRMQVRIPFGYFLKIVHQIHYNPSQKCRNAKSLPLQTIQKPHHRRSFHSKTLRQSQHFHRELDKKTFRLCTLLSSLLVLIVCFST